MARTKAPKTESQVWGRVCQILIQIRQRAGLSQAELAERIGKHQTYVSKLEAGVRRPGVLEVWAICQATGIPFTEFARRLGQ